VLEEVVVEVAVVLFHQMLETVTEEQEVQVVT
jgi:hypothetical protein